MLAHSRDGLDERRPVDLNAAIEEAVNLAYHGARAERPDVNIRIEKDFDPAVGRVALYPQEFNRVLINMVANGIYAANKRKQTAGEAGFEPVLAVTSRGHADTIDVLIRDNGTGIPPEVRARLFEPFFTTKPPGEGTGLGLSISHDIIVKRHGGSIHVESEPGAFTEFRLTLPRTPPPEVKA
jgi:two-component system, NtrC family, sensor kinase